jgi:hypothetical protein
LRKGLLLLQAEQIQKMILGEKSRHFE